VGKEIWANLHPDGKGFTRASNGAVLMQLLLDHGIWTELAGGQRVPITVSAFKAANADGPNFEAWVTATVSKLAEEEMGKLGVKVVERVDELVGYVY
jgi:hypothetical protein